MCFHFLEFFIKCFFSGAAGGWYLRWRDSGYDLLRCCEWGLPGAWWGCCCSLCWPWYCLGSGHGFPSIQVTAYTPSCVLFLLLLHFLPSGNKINLSNYVVNEDFVGFAEVVWYSGAILWVWSASTRSLSTGLLYTEVFTSLQLLWKGLLMANTHW